jgi:signal recognition particle receptor subunit beta
MSFVNYEAKEIISKIIYYGPSLGGKTSNIRYIEEHTKDSSKGKMLSMDNENDRTMFFDFLPLALGTVNDFNVRFHLYSVPGQVFYESSRKLLLKGIDGIVFVVDSTAGRYEANIESMNNLVKSLHMCDIDITDMPLVIQYNKRDVDTAMPINEICNVVNKVNAPEYETVASEGVGVFETLKGISKIIMANLKQEIVQQADGK